MNALLLYVIAVSFPLTIQGLQIVNLPKDPTNGPELCGHICSGVEKWSAGNGWFNPFEAAQEKVAKVVNISACKFLSAPVVTVTTSNEGSGHDVCPSLIVRRVHESSILVYSVDSATVKEMRRTRCDVHWIATGFIC
jgi:hypothetical protein